MSSYSHARRRTGLMQADSIGPFTFWANRLGKFVYRTLQAIIEWPGEVLDRMEVRGRERASIDALSGLNNSALKDIGVNRSEIRFISRSLAKNPDRDHRLTSQ